MIRTARCRSQTGCLHDCHMLGPMYRVSLEPAAHHSVVNSFIPSSRTRGAATFSLFLWADRHVGPSQVSGRPFTERGMVHRYFTTWENYLSFIFSYIHPNFSYFAFTNLQVFSIDNLPFLSPRVATVNMAGKVQDMWKLLQRTGVSGLIFIYLLFIH